MFWEWDHRCLDAALTRWAGIEVQTGEVPGHSRQSTSDGNKRDVQGPVQKLVSADSKGEASAMRPVRNSLDMTCCQPAWGKLEFWRMGEQGRRVASTEVLYRSNRMGEA